MAKKIKSRNLLGSVSNVSSVDLTAKVRAVAAQTRQTIGGIGVLQDVNRFLLTFIEQGIVVDIATFEVVKGLFDTTRLADAAAKAVAKNALNHIAALNDVLSFAVNKGLLESASAGDDVTFAVNKQRADTAAASDAIAKFVTKALSDTARATDTVAKDVNKIPADTATGADTLAKSFDKAGRIDTARGTDSATKFVSKTPTGDTASAGAETVAKFAGKGTSDTSRATDADPTFLASKSVELDPARMSDTAVKQPGKGIPDTTRGTDTASKEAGKGIPETASNADAATKFVTKASADIARGTDAISKQAGKAATDTSSNADSVAKFLTKNISDAITAIETFTIVNNVFSTQADGGRMTDVFSRVVDYVRLFADTARGTDTIAKEAGKTRTDTASNADSVSKQAGKGSADTARGTDTMAREAGKGAADTARAGDETVAKEVAKTATGDIARAGQEVLAKDVSKVLGNIYWNIDQSGLLDEYLNIPVDTTQTFTQYFAIGATDPNITRITDQRPVFLAGKGIDDTLPVPDTLSKQPGKGAADIARGTDTMAREAGKGSADTARGTDSAVKEANKKPADTARGTDTIAKEAGKPVSETARGTDAASKEAGKRPADTARGTDTVSRVHDAVRLPADTARGTDAMSRELNYFAGGDGTAAQTDFTGLDYRQEYLDLIPKYQTQTFAAGENVALYSNNIYEWLIAGNATTGVNCILSSDLNAFPASPVNGTPLKMVTTGLDPYIGSYASNKWILSPAGIGQTWTLSVYVRADVATIGELFIFGYDASGTYIEAPAGAINITTSWSRQSYTYTFTNPSTVAIGYRLDGPNSDIGRSIWWDGAQLEKAASPTFYKPTRTFIPADTYTLGETFDKVPGKGVNDIARGTDVVTRVADYVRYAGNSTAFPGILRNGSPGYGGFGNTPYYIDGGGVNCRIVVSPNGKAYGIDVYRSSWRVYTNINSISPTDGASIPISGFPQTVAAIDDLIYWNGAWYCCGYRTTPLSNSYIWKNTNIDPTTGTWTAVLTTSNIQKCFTLEANSTGALVCFGIDGMYNSTDGTNWLLNNTQTTTLYGLTPENSGGTYYVTVTSSGKLAFTNTTSATWTVNNTGATLNLAFRPIYDPTTNRYFVVESNNIIHYMSAAGTVGTNTVSPFYSAVSNNMAAMFREATGLTATSSNWFDAGFIFGSELIMVGDISTATNTNAVISRFDTTTGALLGFYVTTFVGGGIGSAKRISYVGSNYLVPMVFYTLVLTNTKADRVTPAEVINKTITASLGGDGAFVQNEFTGIDYRQDYLDLLPTYRSYSPDPSQPIRNTISNFSDDVASLITTSGGNYTSNLTGVTETDLSVITQGPIYNPSSNTGLTPTRFTVPASSYNILSGPIDGGQYFLGPLLQPGQNCYFSFYARWEGNIPDVTGFFVRNALWDGVNSATNLTDYNQTPTNTWTRYSLGRTNFLTTPRYMVFRIQGSNTVSTKNLWIDGLQVEINSSLTAYSKPNAFANIKMDRAGVADSRSFTVTKSAIGDARTKQYEFTPINFTQDLLDILSPDPYTFTVPVAVLASAAYFAGGNVFGTETSAIGKLSTPSNTFSALSATLVAGKRDHAAAASSIKGYYFGGRSGATTAVVNTDALTFANETRTNPAAWANAGYVLYASATSSVAAYQAGGIDSTNSSTTDQIVKYIYSTETSNNPFKNLNTFISSIAGTNSSTAAYFGAGSNFSNDLRKVVFSTDTTTTLASRLQTTRYGTSSVSSPTVGYYLGSVSGPTEIDGIIFSTDTATNPAAVWASIKNTAQGCSSTTLGYFGGGYDGASYSSAISTFTFADESVATLGATLSIATRSVASTYFAG